MKKQSLKQHNVDFYQAKTIDHNKLDQLVELTEIIVPSANNFKLHKIAATLVLAILIPLGIFNFYNDNVTLVPQEIALNHAKNLALEFKADEYSELSRLMSKLDFKLVDSTNAHLNGLKVLGSRYCSIQGNLAAQIRLVDKLGVHYTLYQTPLTQKLKSEPLGTFNNNQIEISQWQEKDIFFGLAKSINP